MLAAAPGPLLLRDSRLAPVWDKVQSGVRLSREDGQLLFETEDLHGLGRMADFAKSRRHGEQVFFVLNPSATSRERRAKRAPSRTPSRTCWT